MNNLRPHPLFIAAVFLGVVHLLSVLQNPILPEIDSYGWLNKYESAIATQEIYFYRPLFSGLLLALESLTGLSAFHLLKYLLPFFSLLALLPLWLIASRLRNQFFQVLVLLLPAASPSLLLQFEGLRPQFLGLILAFYIVGLPFSSFLQRKPVYWTDFLTLFVILCGVLYHGIFIIFLFLWTGLFILSHFKEFYERHQLLPWGIAATLFILLAVQMDQIRNYAVYAWQVGLEIIRNFILLQWNLLFPAYYINIDNIQVGWSGFLGVAKYYGFYAGPGILFGLVFLLVLHQGSWAFRREITSYLANRRLWFIWGACLFFFVIAEVLPRFADFSFLPDRALNFFGIFCVLPLFVTLQYLDSRKSPSPWGLFGVGMVFSLLVSVAGAMYVSYQFKFLSTEQERVAHEWVEANLPENRVFYTTGSDERLSYHSDSLAYPLNPEKIQQRDLENLLRTLSVRVLNERITFLEQEIENIRGLNITEKINVSYVPEDRILANEELFDQLLSVVEAQKIAARNADRYLEELEDLKQKINRYNNIYIFVSAPDPRNPYSKRPYLTAYSNTLYEEENAFYAEHPEYFVRVYEENGVSIWKFKGLNGAPLP